MFSSSRRYYLCKRFCQNVMSPRAVQSSTKLLKFVHFENNFPYVYKKAHIKRCIKTCQRRFYCMTKRRLVLGIETSCDDTGAAVVDDKGEVLGEALNSQTSTTVRLGGVIPTIARDLHKQNIEQVVTECLALSKVKLEDLDAIAVTVKPGFAMSLRVGLEYAKQLARESGKPLIPIHHMEAHALTVRLIERIEFPFLVLLLSGGHCLLAVARDVEDFLLLGRCIDDSPGDAFDKTARRLKLKDLPECEGLSGGASIELLASRGNPREMQFPNVMTANRNCNFSFTGLKSSARKLIMIEEERQGVAGGTVLPNVADVCASFQFAILSHIARRLERALIFCDYKELMTGENTLVVSGGVASNQFIRRGLGNMCTANNTRLVCPPMKLCTDNGVMIAWNGMEKLMKGSGIVEDVDSVDFQPKCPLGTDIIADVQREDIKLPRLSALTKLLLQDS